jgi:hypothetical protein
VVELIIWVVGYQHTSLRGVAGQAIRAELVEPILEMVAVMVEGADIPYGMAPTQANPVFTEAPKGQAEVELVDIVAQVVLARVCLRSRAEEVAV